VTRPPTEKELEELRSLVSLINDWSEILTNTTARLNRRLDALEVPEQPEPKPALRDMSTVGGVQ
jgi:hypothetical protein